MNTNLFNTTCLAKEKVGMVRKKIECLSQLDLQKDQQSSDVASLGEIERVQDYRQGLITINDPCFEFFQSLLQVINNSMNLESLKKDSCQLSNNTSVCLRNEVKLHQQWKLLFKEDTDSECITYVDDIFENVTGRCLKVCQKQFLSDTKDQLNIDKKKAHRKSITERKVTQSDRIHITMMDVKNDTSDNKESTHMKLKLNSQADSEFFDTKHFNKNDLLVITKAYELVLTGTSKLKKG